MDCSLEAVGDHRKSRGGILADVSEKCSFL